MKQDASPMQFEELVTRMMPNAFSKTGEGRLIAGIFAQAWRDAKDYQAARAFFTDAGSSLSFYCDLVGLNAQQLRELFLDHHGPYKRHLEEIAA